jgi:hypothetical protein
VSHFRSRIDTQAIAGSCVRLISLKKQSKNRKHRENRSKARPETTQSRALTVQYLADDTIHEPEQNRAEEKISEKKK